jgi:hypothetical protein
MKMIDHILCGKTGLALAAALLGACIVNARF